MTKEAKKVGVKFSGKGRRQMRADISYLANVINALDVDTGDRIQNLNKYLDEIIDDTD